MRVGCFAVADKRLSDPESGLYNVQGILIDFEVIRAVKRCTRGDIRRCGLN